MREKGSNKEEHRKLFRDPIQYLINFEEFICMFYENEKFAKGMWKTTIDMLKFFPTADESVPGDRDHGDRTYKLLLPLYELAKRIAKDSADSGELPSVTNLSPIFLQGDHLTVTGDPSLLDSGLSTVFGLPTSSIKVIGSVPSFKRDS